MEEVKGLRCKTSRISYLWNYLLLILLALFLILLLPYLNFVELYSQIIFLIIFSIGLILLLEPESEKLIKEYFITENEIKKIEGVFSKKEVSIPYQSVADVTLIKSLVGKIFNFGDIFVKGVKGNIRIKGVKEPEKILRIIENRISRFKGEESEED
ncbi:MAG: PH domain-containing protein [Candidatus Aenigmatarchaeota archaeon]